LTTVKISNHKLEQIKKNLDSSLKKDEKIAISQIITEVETLLSKKFELPYVKVARATFLENAVKFVKRTYRDKASVEQLVLLVTSNKDDYLKIIKKFKRRNNLKKLDNAKVLSFFESDNFKLSPAQRTLFLSQESMIELFESLKKL
jgi:hypothetical protein